MIYCPECGTANRNSSTFCHDCGGRLDAFALIKCSECGAMNPVQQASCSGCGARLLSAASGPEGAEASLTTRGLFLPTKGATSGEDSAATAEGPAALEEQVPAWLLELEAKWQAESDAPADSANEDSDLQDRPGGLPAALPAAQEVASPEDDQAASLGPAEEEEEQEVSLTAAEEAQVTLAEAAELGIPPWLAELQGVAGAKTESGEEITEGTEGEAPPWLAELRDAAGAGPEESALLEATEGEASDWLAALHMAAQAKAAEERVPEADESEIPDQWAEMLPGETEALDAGEPELAEEIEALDTAGPEPLVPVISGEEEEISEAMPEPAIAERRKEDEEAVDRAAELEMEGAEALALPEEDALDRSTEIPLPEEDWTEEDEILAAERREPPDWLAELGELLEDEELEVFEPPVPDEEEAFVAAEELYEAAHTEESTEAPDGGEPAAMDQEKDRSAIPVWMLAMEPPEATGEAERPAPDTWAEEPMEGSGLLAGIQGLLSVEAIIAQPRSATQRTVLTPFPASDAPQAQLFADIVGRSPHAEPKELEEVRRQGLGMVPRLVVFLALIAAVTAPLLLAEPLWSRNLVANPPVRNLYDKVQMLDGRSLVLLAFDYDPSTTDEMNVLVEMLVDHVMERGAGIVAVSLYPAGPPVAQALLNEVAAQHPDYAGAYGRRYVNLGYLPGQATAVRLLGQSLPMALPQDYQGTLLAELPLVEGVAGLQDFSLVLELAASEQSVRWWIEQAATPYDVPLAAGVSASAAPFVQPYYRTEPRQLVGLAGGLPDAAAYATLRTDPEARGGPLAARLDSLTGGHLVFILVLVIGSVVQLVRRSRGGR